MSPAAQALCPQALTIRALTLPPHTTCARSTWQVVYKVSLWGPRPQSLEDGPVGPSNPMPSPHCGGHKALGLLPMASRAGGKGHLCPRSWYSRRETGTKCPKSPGSSRDPLSFFYKGGPKTNRTWPDGSDSAPSLHHTHVHAGLPGTPCSHGGQR